MRLIKYEIQVRVDQGVPAREKRNNKKIKAKTTTATITMPDLYELILREIAHTSIFHSDSVYFFLSLALSSSLLHPLRYIL